MADERKPGWDKQAINRIAKEQYGGLKEMFAAHNWSKGDKTFGQIAPAKVVKTYGSVASFEKAHLNGRDGNALLNPLAAILAETPDVWLTSYYGFAPEIWAMLGFTYESERDTFVANTSPGALVVIYGTKNGADPDEAGKVLGVQQITHEVGPGRQFTDPETWQRHNSDPNESDYWNHAVKVVRAWKVAAPSRPNIDDFASDTYSANFAQTIARRGKRMSKTEAEKLLSLDLVEVSVFDGAQIEQSVVTSGAVALSPSRAGPVSQKGFWREKSEGPKHLYVLKLLGDTEAFLGKKVSEKRVYKVGMSGDPASRCGAFNASLPECAFQWRLEYSTAQEGRDPFPTSAHAICGENKMKNYLAKHGDSLGNEFFLADESAIERAWKKAKIAAEKYNK